MSDVNIQIHKWEPDDHGGGFPCITIDATIYTETELDQVINRLLKKRKALRKELKRACME